MKRGIRIGLTGAGGVGKTKTITMLREMYPEMEQLATFPSASRLVYEANDLSEAKVAAEYTPEQKWELQLKIFETKVKMDDSHMQFMTDRTLLDHWAYCLMYCAADMPDNVFMQYEALTRKHMLGAYSHIFYLPWGYWEAKGDGVRQDKKAWQYMVDTLIMGRLISWGIPVIEAPQTQGPEFRAQFVYNTVMDVDVQKEKE